MKVKFSIKEKLYAICNFKIECESQDEVEEALDEIGESVSADDLYYGLIERFGSENVSADGINSTDNIETEDEYEFWNWEEKETIQLHLSILKEAMKREGLIFGIAVDK